MTPYVANEEKSCNNKKAAAPRSIMVHPSSLEDAAPPTNNGDVVHGILQHQSQHHNAVHANHHHQQDLQDGQQQHLNNTTNNSNGDAMTDSIKPLLNGKGKGLHNGHARGGKAGALKRVSFGSSKGSMVETLVYDHNDDLHFPRLVAPGGPAPIHPHHQQNHPTTNQVLILPSHHPQHQQQHIIQQPKTNPFQQNHPQQQQQHYNIKDGQPNNNRTIVASSELDKVDNNVTTTNTTTTTTPHINGKANLNELEAFGLNWPILISAGVALDLSEEAPLLPSRVKVSFYESQKPNYVTTPESPDIPLDFLNLSSAMSTPPVPGNDYERQESTDSGLDNPFRPDGELSREADTIVSLIKEGKPITPIKGEPEGGNYFGDDLPDGTTQPATQQQVIENSISPVKSKGHNLEHGQKNHGVNGNGPKDLKGANSPLLLPGGVVEVQHGVVVPPSDASQVEQVVIKKKPKCKCCVIQ